MARITKIRVNGTIHRIDADERLNLLDVLREQLDFSGTKYGCGEDGCEIKSKPRSFRDLGERSSKRLNSAKGALRTRAFPAIACRGSVTCRRWKPCWWIGAIYPRPAREKHPLWVWRRRWETRFLTPQGFDCVLCRWSQMGSNLPSVRKPSGPPSFAIIVESKSALDKRLYH